MSDLLRKRDQLKERMVALDRALVDPKVLCDAREMRRLGRERNHVTAILSAMTEFDVASRGLAELEALLHAGDDPDLVTLAREEIDGARERAAGAEAALRQQLVPRDPNDTKSAIVEIRAGTGGEEAALFARDIYRMYARYAEGKGFRLDLMSSSTTELGGVKEIVLLLEGEDAYGTMKYESGVHRVQRVPETEAQGRIHTSAISVAVLPEAEEVDVEVAEKDLKVDVFRSSGPGGQSVNTTDSAVRITHLPTGLVVQCQDERSQLKNKNKAMTILRSRLLDRMRSEREQAQAVARRGMVSTGDRSAKIRTYNFPQSRVTDHRIGLTVYNLPGVLEGDLDPLIGPLRLADNEARLSGEV